MRQAAQSQLAGHGFGLPQGADTSHGEDPIVRDILRRCSPETRLAAREFRRTGRTEHLPAIIDGVIEHYADPDVRAKLRGGDGKLRLVEDLAIDSLTLLEIIFLAEEVLGITIDNEEVRPFRTVDDVRGFIIAKVQGSGERAPAGSR
jgi:3-hydroxyacyl-[acyl-carrier-protein] dehydratase